NNSTGVLQANVDSTANNQAGQYVSYEEGMQGTCAQIGIISQEALETYTIDGYVNANGGQPGCVALVGEGSNISIWEDNNNDNDNHAIWGPVFYYNSEFGSPGASSYNFISTSGSYSPSTTVNLTQQPSNG